MLVPYRRRGRKFASPSVAAVLFVLMAVPPHGVVAQDLQRYLQSYFAGNLIQYSYGAGVSSSRPRVELAVHYCPSGQYFSSGRSCRPNIVAKGFQCSGFRDAGRWRIVAQGRQAMLQWTSSSSGPGGIALRVRNDGVVIDPQGNPFVRVGRALCR